MSTNAYVIEKLEDGSYRGIYIHNDGYVTHTGRLLVEHFNTSELATQLVDLGDCSSMGKGVDDVVSYVRDKGEDMDDNIPRIAESVDELSGSDYSYVFEDGVWMVTKKNITVPVTQALVEWKD